MFDIVSLGFVSIKLEFLCIWSTCSGIYLFVQCCRTFSCQWSLALANPLYVHSMNCLTWPTDCKTYSGLAKVRSHWQLRALQHWTNKQIDTLKIGFYFMSNMSIKYTEIPTLLIKNKWNYVKHIRQPWNNINNKPFLPSRLRFTNRYFKLWLWITTKFK